MQDASRILAGPYMNPALNTKHNAIFFRNGICSFRMKWTGHSNIRKSDKTLSTPYMM